MTHLKRSDDGITHLNVWSKAKTELGQMASNFALSPFTHPEYGGFASIEALWYWLATGLQHNELRRLYGVSAKTAGKRLTRVEMDSEKFQHIIKEAIKLKFEQIPGLKKLLIESTLPFEHYYVYGHNSDVIRDQREKHGWQTDHLERLRDKWRIEAGLAPFNHIDHKLIHNPENDRTQLIGRGSITPDVCFLDENSSVADTSNSCETENSTKLSLLSHDDIEINGF